MKDLIEKRHLSTNYGVIIFVLLLICNLNLSAQTLSFKESISAPVLTHINNFESPVGDCIFNKFRGEFLLSQNEDFGTGTPASIVRYNSSNGIEGEINLMETGGSEVYYKNATKMFIDPNGILYILVNSVVGDINPPGNEFPYILTYNANTYDFIKSYQLNDFTSTDIVNTSEYYMVHFCFSKSNNTTYFSVTPQDISLPPYHSEYNTMYNSWAAGYTPNNGYLYSIKDETLTVENNGNPIIHPGKIICPDDGNDDNQSINEGKLFIVSDILRTYVYSTKEMDSFSKKVNDIVYSPFHDKVFAFADEGLDGDCNSNRTAVVYQVMGSFPISFEQITNGTYAGQASSFFFNPYNNKLYLQTKFDSIKLGVSPAKLIELDIEPGTSIATKTEITLYNNTYPQNRSFYPELDHCPDFGYFTCNLTTPTIDPYRNVMYLPNGSFSNVSVVEFAPNEPLLLNNDEYDWISIPRLNRNNGDPSVNDVLYNHIFPDNYLHDSSILINVPPDFTYPVYSIYTGFTWPSPFGLSNIYSTRGYKLKLKYEEQPIIKWLQMEGDVIDPNTSIPLFGGKDNWVGYFLYKEQDIFDALGEVLHYSLVIRGEDWFCYYNGPFRNPGNPLPTSDGWICDNNKHNVKYGNMVIIETDWVPEGYTFTWQNSGLPTDNISTLESDYFTYTETADYTPISILLDTTENPTEIGAFVNDSCIGACTVLPEDTLIGIKAYLEGQSGDSITFETWTNTKSTSRKKINGYNLFNPISKRYEKKSIKLNEKRNIYKVSFRKLQTPDIEYPDNVIDFWIYPNPAKHNLYIEYELENKSEVAIKVYNILGSEVAIIIQGNQLAGKQKLFWDLTKDNGEQLPSGIYTIRLKAGVNAITKKIVVN